MNYIQNMDIVHFYRLVKKAQEKTEREEIYQFYCAIFPYLEGDNRVSFDEFLNQNRETKAVIFTKSNDEIMEELLKGKG